MKEEWDNFSKRELMCKCGCGKSNPNEEFVVVMDLVQRMRDELGFGLKISSGYRCEDHPVERGKSKPGRHNIGAVDIAVDRGKAWLVLNKAMELGFTGIGVNQKGEGRFIHLDCRESGPTVWSY